MNRREFLKYAGVGSLGGAMLAQSALAAPMQRNENDSISIDVKKFGAVGNGFANDTGPIQSAIDHIEARPGHDRPTILFPPGNYKITGSSLKVSKGGMRFRGEGGVSRSESPPYYGSTLFSPDKGGFTLMDATPENDNHEGPIFENLNFISTAGDRSAHLLAIGNYNRGTVKNCTFREGQEGILIKDSDDVAWWLFEQNVFNNNAIGIKSEAHSLTGIGANLITGGDFNVPPGGWAVVLGSAVQQCRIIGIKVDGGSGVQIGGGSNIVMGSNFENCGPAIQLVRGVHPSPHDGRYNIIIGNHFNGTGVETAVQIFKGADRNTLVGNTFSFLGERVSDAASDNLRIDNHKFSIDTFGYEIDIPSPKFSDGRINLEGKMPLIDFTNTDHKNWRIDTKEGNMRFKNTTDETGVLTLSSDGNILMPNLPTSDPKVAGGLWNNRGVLSISAG